MSNPRIADQVTASARLKGMPASVGEPSTETGGVHAKIQFEAQGLHGSRDWTL